MRITGVVEGFYGPPWSHADRLHWVDQLAAWEMTHYVWAPKAEPRHRRHWDEPFTEAELQQFTELVERQASVAVGVGLTPGPGATAAQVIDKLRPSVAAGATVVVLSCDDLPALDAGARHRALAEAMRSALDCTVWVVPTHYAGAHDSPYLRALCDGLHDAIELMWTGDHVVNDTIGADEARQRAAVTGRPPLLWDNTPVSDAVMGESVHLGPLAGRDPDLRDVCRGVLWNPMEHPRASMLTLASAAAWCRGADPVAAWLAWARQHGAVRIAEATAFRGDPHWPGESPDRDWWHEVAALPDEPARLGLDAGLQPWLDAARSGASIVVDALAVADRISGGEESTALTIAQLALAARWRRWRRDPVLVFGGGPRLRPVISQDDRGEFVTRAGSVELEPNLVDLAVQPVLQPLRPDQPAR